MNITPDLAAKVLDADLRNIVKKVSDGGILSPSERQLLQGAAFPESPAKSKRALILALKHSSGGRLTASELAEVREMHPGFAPEVVAADDAASDVAGSAPLTLTPEPTPAGGDCEVTAAQIKAWSEIYGVERRQLYRWIERGKEHSDPCPLDDPRKMPQWIETHIEKVRSSLREKVAAAAEIAHAKAPPPPVEAPAPSPSASSGAAPAVIAAPVVKGLQVTAIDLAAVGGVDGDLYSFQLSAVAGIKQHLVEAYASGDDFRIGKVQSRLDKAGEQLRKYEQAAEKKAIRMGNYLPKAEVFNEVMQSLSTLALMREQRKKRIRAELADLPQEILARIDLALERTGASEEAVLRNLAQMKSPADVLLTLAA